MKVLVLYAHPAQQHSNVNTAMSSIAQSVEGISFLDLYAKYPRLDLDIQAEQDRLLAHDAIVFQFPLMWYSTPPILKEWQDLVLEYGFAYGEGGDRLKGKLWLTAVTAGSPESAYGPEGHNKVGLRALLAPLEATANLCQMPFIAPYALFSSLKAENASAHVEGYKTLLTSLRDNTFNATEAQNLSLLSAASLPSLTSGVEL